MQPTGQSTFKPPLFLNSRIGTSRDTSRTPDILRKKKVQGYLAGEILRYDFFVAMQADVIEMVLLCYVFDLNRITDLLI